MPTPANAPYKLAQADAALALRASRRHARIDRAKLVNATVNAARAVQLARGTDVLPRAERRLRSLVAMLSRAERIMLGVR